MYVHSENQRIRCQFHGSFVAAYNRVKMRILNETVESALFSIFQKATLKTKTYFTFYELTCLL